MHILGAYVHIFVRYKVSMIKVSLGQLYTNNEDADANTDMDDNASDNDTLWTTHDCIGSLPNEPKSISR